MEKKCYICLPISGAEDSAIERANEAAKFVRENLGLDPLTPMDINEESQETLNDSDRPIEFFMGNDIKALIGECDSIFVCEGWEKSKGCNVEVECAKQYNKKIFYQKIPANISLKEAIDVRREYLVQIYRGASKNFGPWSKNVQEAVKNIREFDKFIENGFLGYCSFNCPT